MSDAKKPSIPAWQLAPKPSSPESPSEPVDASSEASANSEPAPSPSDDTSNTLKEQVQTFLRDPSIQDAPVEQKRAFLESKGVSQETIALLLEEEGKAHIEKGELERTEARVILDTSKRDSPQPRSQPQPQSQPQSQSQSQPSPPPQSQIQRPVAPPIVTYPEFLTQPTAPAPLVTIPRLVNTAYFAGALTATFYGLSKFIIAPMTDSLTSARHEFAQNTQSRLEEFNEKLSAMVSIDPGSTHGKLDTGKDEDDDDSSTDSDPTELFHRDFGTQTSPMDSRRQSAAAANATTAALPPFTRVAAEHEEQLKIMSSHLKELAEGNQNNGTTNETLKNELHSLTSYLTEMKFQIPGYGMNSYGIAKPVGDKGDAVEALRADIRSVKGVLLSARNFPGMGRK